MNCRGGSPCDVGGVTCRTLVLGLLCCVLVATRADEAFPTNIVLRPLSNGVFQLGPIRLNKAERSISFDAVANIISDLTVEYALVHKIGKTHETMFRTDVRAQELHVAMLLLGVKAAMTNQFPDDLKLPPPGDPVTVEVSWQRDGAKVKYDLEDLIINRETGKSLNRGVWFYNGSNFSEGMFTAQRDGSIISIHIDPDALINNPRPGRDNDDLHLPNAKLLPPTGTPVQFTIRLATKSS